MKILAVDTSGSSLSVALVEDRIIKAEMSYDSGTTHGKLLLSFVDKLLCMTGFTLQDMDGFAVTKGPGSFTGLRIGISTIKGLADAVGKPFLGVSSLDALAFQLSHSNKTILPMIDARRGEVYHACYTFCDGILKDKTPESVSAPELLADTIKEPVVIMGSGAIVYGYVFKSLQKNLVHEGGSCMNSVRAGVCGILAWDLLKEGKPGGFENVELSYIRKSDAEINFISV
jgi:tRNA threonylcarbamoyladenosine biosynthesis protein TsaB